MSSYWHRQAVDKPLFPDLLWSRPENRHSAGKLLIIGGNAHGFAAVSEAYQAAMDAGIGTVRILLPDSVKKLIGNSLENGEFAPSTASGSFARTALSEFLAHSEWADGVLIAGELGHNSETAILLEHFLTKTAKTITLARDTVDNFKSNARSLLERPGTCLVVNIEQLQKLCVNAGFKTPITFSMDLAKLVETLSDLTTKYQAHFIVKHFQNIVVASGEQVSTTQLKEDIELWRIKTAVHASVWWLQNLSKPFEALTMAVYTIVNHQ